jgi:hypothetical protein
MQTYCDRAWAPAKTLLEAIWPDLQARRQAQLELERYGEESHEPEAARVRLAILKLCEGQLERVEEYPSQAQALWTLQPRLSKQQRPQLEDLQQQAIKYSSRDELPYICAAPTLRRNHLG